MKILLDESVDVSLRTWITGHAVFTVTYMGWKGFKNGDLLARAVDEGFEVLITTDRAMAYQHDVRTMGLALMVLLGQSNDLGDLTPLVPELLVKLNHVQPNTVTQIAP